MADTVPPAQQPPALTPFQPTGPYPQVMLDLPTGTAIPLSTAARGERILVEGRLLDGAGQPVFDAMIETWQADASGRYAHPQDPRSADADRGFWGYHRVATDNDGRFRIETIKPGAPSASAGAGRPAPHLLIGIYGGGILYRYVTRIYFGDEPGNPSDPVLQLVPAARRRTLIASRDGSTYRIDLRLQGDQETVFFDI
jgi:protocatechuate 3,4-dioxygenase alpha subunit